MTLPRELLKAETITAMEANSYTHPLNPNAVRLTKNLGRTAGLTQMGMHLVTIMPGRDSTEYHVHHHEDECIYILSGHGTALLDGARYPVGPGDFIGCPRKGIAHAMSNTGSEPLVMLVAGTHLEQEVCDYPLQKKRLFVSGADRAFVDLP